MRVRSPERGILTAVLTPPPKQRCTGSLEKDQVVASASKVSPLVMSPQFLLAAIHTHCVVPKTCTDEATTSPPGAVGRVAHGIAPEFTQWSSVPLLQTLGRLVSVSYA